MSASEEGRLKKGVRSLAQKMASVSHADALSGQRLQERRLLSAVLDLSH